ncbi:MAG TPA: hypothetical protein PKV93_14155, partial [Fervidobacterium sp.]|nr:hypothetical protein [Fervidobacterium sp.]
HTCLERRLAGMVLVMSVSVCGSEAWWVKLKPGTPRSWVRHHPAEPLGCGPKKDSPFRDSVARG